jgi:hypothetical protein
VGYVEGACLSICRSHQALLWRANQLDKWEIANHVVAGVAMPVTWQFPKGSRGSLRCVVNSRGLALPGQARHQDSFS